MYLTEIAQSLVEGINASSPENWGGSTGSGLVVPTDLSAKFALDPFADSGTSYLDIYVIPGFIELDLSTRRTPSAPPGKRKYITVAVSARIRAEADAPTYDVTTEAEAIKLVDIKEDLDNFVAAYAITGAILKSMETEPANELELKDSFYVAISVLEYAAC